jgi:protocatechuate 3,4-dioxygenase beta subunit
MMSISLSHKVLAVFLFMLVSGVQQLDAASCTPTEPHMLGPFYKSGADLRTSVGKGYVLSGTIKSSRDCSIIAGAMIELWLAAGPDNAYSDAYRTTIYSDKAGSYRFESPVPQPIEGRPPHIHLKVSSRGFQTLVTQHYPESGRTTATFDIVLIPDAPVRP